MQLTFFYFLPTMLLSGFMFPFRGMPEWAQAIGNVLPATYFMRLVRGILLKGNDLAELWPNIWPLMVFTVAMMTIAHSSSCCPLTITASRLTTTRPSSGRSCASRLSLTSLATGVLLVALKNALAVVGAAF